jgi:hypothetical protein
VAVQCRFTLIPDGDVLEFSGNDKSTYEDALLSFEINPDTVLILGRNRTSIPQDALITEKSVDIVLTCSRG